MKRIHEIDLNTPQYFDRIWSLEGVHYFDRVRMEAFTKHVRDGDTVLDVGAGLFSWGQYILHLGQPKADVHAIDFCPRAVETVTRATPAIHYTLGNVLAMPYDAAAFDVVGAGEVIEHMERPSDLVREMARVAKSNGILILGTVDPHCEDGKDLEYPEHLWEFTVDDLLNLMRPFGAPLYERVGNYDFVHCVKA